MPQHLNLLQVADSESDAESIRSELHRAGYETSSLLVQDGAALAAALAGSEWDLIVCDYWLPGFDASAVLKTVGDSGVDIPVLVVSDVGGEDRAVAAIKSGAHDFLMKDNLDRLGAAVERELRDADARAARRAEFRAVADREARLSLAVEAAELGIFDFEPKSGNVYYSDQARRHLRLHETETPSLAGLLQSLHPDDRPEVESAVRRAYDPAGDGRYAAEYRLRETEEGVVPWISAVGRVLRDASGQPTRFLGLVRDITGRKRAERDLGFQLQLTACITEQSADAIILTDPQGRVRFVNPEAERIFGYTFEEFQAATAHELLHHRYPDGSPYPAEECVYSAGLPTGVTLRDHRDVFFNKDGSPVDVSVSCVPLMLGGAMIGVVFTIRDIRDRMRAEQQLRRSDERFRRLFEADIIGLAIVEGDYIVEANGYLLRLIGYTAEEFAGGKLQWRAITASESLSACENALRLIGETGVSSPLEKEYVRRDGTRVPVLFAGASLAPGRDAPVLCFAFDLSDRKNLEKQVRQAQKLEAIGLLAGGIAHDFNNLLTVILGYTDILLAGLAESRQFAGPIEQISTAAERAAALTRQLLTFSRRKTGESTTLDLAEVVRSLEGMLRRLIGETIEIIVTSSNGSYGEAGGGNLLIRADRGMIEQVIMNLVVNARDAMPDGGRLYLETGLLDVVDGFSLSSLAVAAGAYVSLSVTDTGTGMSQEVQSRLFEPFFTTKEPGRGTGLGLATVYGIVRQSGGAISVHSSEGLGTTMRVLFPVVRPEPMAVPEKASTPAPAGTETVLLVEDESGVRRYVREVLENNGYRALDAANGEDAMMLASRFEGKIHLLVTDVVLPGMKGAELIERLLEVRPDLKVLRMSGYPERFGPSRAGEKWSNGIPHLQKPFTTAQFLSRIREVLGSV